MTPAPIANLLTRLFRRSERNLSLTRIEAVLAGRLFLCLMQIWAWQIEGTRYCEPFASFCIEGSFIVNRAFLTKLHLILAAFMFPAVLMFLVTGALYTWGNKGAWYEESATVALESPFAGQSDAQMQALAVSELEQRGLPLPSGKLAIETGDDASLTWNGAQAEIELSASADPMIAEATIREASFHRWMVQLHKAKGSTAFKVYATILASVLFLLVASGIIMGLQVKSLRGITIGSSVVGALAFIGAVMLG